MKAHTSRRMILAMGILGAANSAIGALPGLRVVGRFLYAPSGEKIVPHGINDETVWLGKSGIPAFQEIAKTKANCVRMAWDRNGTAAELDVAIANAVRNGMVPMPELHDATGNIAGVPAVVDRWTSAEFVKVIQKHEKYLVINIANEAGDWQTTDQQFENTYNLAVQRMRRAGIRVPLVIDADNWGQNYQAISNCAADIMSKDSLKNVMFSVHMYWTVSANGSKAATEARIRNSLDDAVAKGIPLIVGEFGEAFTAAGVVAPGDSIPFRTIMAECNKREIGWLPWSWRGNKPQTDLDMSPDGTYAGLKLWGLEAMVTDPNSVARTTNPIKYIADGLASGAFPSTRISPPGDSASVRWSVVGKGQVAVAPNLATVAHGDVVSFVAVPATGWVFSHWTGSSNSTSEHVVVAANGDLDLTAVFAPGPGTNVLSSGDFATGSTGWSALAVHGTGSATGSVSGGEYVATIADAGTLAWDVQLIQPGIPLVHGKTYELAFDAYALSPRGLSVKLGRDGGAWAPYDTMHAALGTTRQSFRSRFEMDSATDSAARLEFNMGAETPTIHLDNVSLVEVDAASLLRPGPAKDPSRLSVERRSNGWMVSCAGRSCGTISMVSLDGRARTHGADASGFVASKDVPPGLYVLKRDGHEGGTYILAP